jgi:hypothetical protein
MGDITKAWLKITEFTIKRSKKTKRGITRINLLAIETTIPLIFLISISKYIRPYPENTARQNIKPKINLEGQVSELKIGSL